MLLFVVNLVHNANDSSYTDFKSIKNGFKMPCYLAPGNDDVGNVPSISTLNYYRNKIGKDYFTFENKGAAFVVTNTQLWKIDAGYESVKHHRWIKKTLDSLSTSNIPVFVIGHYPLFLKTPEEKEVYFNLPIEIREEILELFKQSHVKAYLSGHTHETIVNNFENIQFVSGETTSKNFDKRPLGFRLWNVKSDSMYHEFVPLKKYQD